MAQTGFTPIQLYSTSTAAAAPAAGNLTNSTLGSELAINITDGKLFYKDNADAVQVIGWKTVPTTAGGTGLTTYTAGDLSYYASGTTFTKLAIGTAGQILTSTGSAPQWTTLSGVAVTTFSAGTTGFTPNSATSGAVTLAGTLATTNGGTGLTSFTANGVFYASSTSAVAQSASLTFSGTTLTAGNYSTGGNLTFTGTGNRITGDFSNATIINRVAFQTSTANSATTIMALPSGSGTNTQLLLRSSSSAADDSFGQIVLVGGSAFTINSTAVGTGTFLPMTFGTGGSERLRIVGGAGSDVGFVGIGTTTPAARLDVLGQAMFQGSTLSTQKGALIGAVNINNNSADGVVDFTQGLVFTSNVSNAGAWSHAGIVTTGSSGFNGSLIFGTDGGGTSAQQITERMRITSGGEVYIAGTADQGAYNLQCNGTGVWGAGAYVNGSDERIKDNIAPIDSGLDVVARLNPVTYKYKETWSKDQSTQTGFIAQELLTALEGKNYVDGVVQQGGQYMSVAYQNIIPILTKAIQELKATVDAQAARIAALEGIV